MAEFSDTIEAVPDLTGEPPSTAVRSNFISCCSSRSNSFSKTNSPYFRPALVV
uniref:Uncharacterized protein n=1 Tax=Sphaeramia orbicularis TaxID=375764 RepID=A0A672YJG2_9TELE